MSSLRRVVVLLSLLGACRAYTVLEGGALAWTVTNDNTSVAGSVPGGVYSSLMEAGLLTEGDYYYGYNDLNYRWVSYVDWQYETTIPVSAELSGETRIVLEFEGIDTAATITANDQIVGTTDNMFVKYYFDITDAVKSSSEVSLKVAISSPVEWSKLRYDEQAANYVVPPECLDPAYNGECHANHIRKMQSSYSWDWGPAFPSLGIWKPMRVIGFSSALITGMMVDMTPWEQLPKIPDHDFRTNWDLDITLEFLLANSVLPVDGTLNFRLGDAQTVAGVSLGGSGSDVLTEKYLFPVGANFSLWWPAGYGEQPLYDLTVEFSSARPAEVIPKAAKIGFRTVELDQGVVDDTDFSKGRHYRVFINNVLVFMRGSNWIPAHVLPELVTVEYTRQLLQDAVDSNQNSIRIWGGGIYESDAFYEICDELGIVVWQDLMFACSMYPTSDWFLSSVTSEISTQVMRLNTHPSVIVYITNNENEAALRDNWYGTGSDFELYKADYITLYVDNIRPQINEADPYHIVALSSPSNGIETDNEGYVSQSPGNPLYGDVHFYNYANDGWNHTTFPKPRFASEYGYQSWPSFRTLSEVTAPEDWVVGSDMLEHRQHHPNGQTELEDQLSRHLIVPDSSSGEKGFRDYLYLTQIHQAMAIRTESEQYRRLTYTVDADGYGYTAGALYWQLNDIWQGASWASIEYGGRWKMLHYYVKKFFNPTLVSPYIEGDQVLVSFVNDVPTTVEGIDLTVTIWGYDSLTPRSSLTVPALSFEPQSASVVASFNMTEDLDLSTVCTTTDECFLTFSATDADGSPAAPDNFILLGEPRDAPLLPANVQVLSVEGPETVGNSEVYTIVVTTDVVALFVFLETDVAGVFSDNGFVLTQPSLVLEFYSREATTAAELQASIEIKTLVDTVQTKA